MGRSATRWIGFDVMGAETRPVQRDATPDVVPAFGPDAAANPFSDPNSYWSPANPYRDSVADSDTGAYYPGRGVYRDRADTGRNVGLGCLGNARLEIDWEAGHCNHQLARLSLCKVIP